MNKEVWAKKRAKAEEQGWTLCRGSTHDGRCGTEIRGRLQRWVYPWCNHHAWVTWRALRYIVLIGAAVISAIYKFSTPQPATQRDVQEIVSRAISQLLGAPVQIDVSRYDMLYPLGWTLFATDGSVLKANLVPPRAGFVGIVVSEADVGPPVLLPSEVTIDTPRTLFLGNMVVDNFVVRMRMPRRVGFRGKYPIDGQSADGSSIEAWVEIVASNEVGVAWLLGFARARRTGESERPVKERRIIGIGGNVIVNMDFVGEGAALVPPR